MENRNNESRNNTRGTNTGSGYRTNSNQGQKSITEKRGYSVPEKVTGSNPTPPPKE